MQYSRASDYNYMAIQLLFLLSIFKIKIGFNRLSICYNIIIYVQVYTKKIILIKIKNKNIFIFLE